MEIFPLLDFYFASRESLDPLLDLWPDFSLTLAGHLTRLVPLGLYDSMTLVSHIVKILLNIDLFPLLVTFHNVTTETYKKHLLFGKPYQLVCFGPG